MLQTEYTSLNLIIIDRFGYLNKKLKSKQKFFLNNSVLFQRDESKSTKMSSLANKKFEKSNL